MKSTEGGMCKMNMRHYRIRKRFPSEDAAAEAEEKAVIEFLLGEMLGDPLAFLGIGGVRDAAEDFYQRQLSEVRYDATDPDPMRP